MDKVHVTAISFLSPLGNDLAALADGLRAGRSGVRFLTDQEVPADFPIRYAAKVTLPPVEGRVERAGDAQCQFLRAAAWMARDLARQLPEGTALDAFGFFGRAKNSFSLALDLFRGDRTALDRLHLNSELEPQQVIIDLLREERNASIAKTFFLGSACTSGSVLLGTAFRRIRAGEWKRALLGNIEIDSNPLQTMGLHLIGALSRGFPDATRASRPFAPDRNGFVKGEAATLILLESEREMLKRGGRSLAEITGFSNTSDAYQFAEGLPDGRELENAMKLAMADARVEAGDIDYVKAHATSTPAGDLIESAAIARVFGAGALRPAVSAPKSQLGHSTSACSAMECIAVLAMMKHGFLSPTLNLETVDPAIAEHGLDLVGPRAREHRIRTALLNSGGFGGQNSCLVLRSPGHA